MKETSADRYEQVEKLKVPYTLQVWHKLSDKDDSLFDGEEPEEYWFKTYEEAANEFWKWQRWKWWKRSETQPTHLILMKYGYLNDPESGDCMDEWDINEDKNNEV